MMSATHPFPARHLFVLGLTATLFLLAGCDGGLPPWNCKDACPIAGWKRDFFCNCYDPSEYKSKAPGRPADSQVLNADCVCQLPNGDYESHFFFKPANFSSLNGRELVIAADNCDDIRACPDLDPLPPDDDNLHVHQEFFTGKFRQRVLETSHYENFVHDTESWSLRGPILGQAMLSPPKDQIASLNQGSAAPASTDLPPLDCAKHCDPGDEYCLRYALPPKYAQPMRSLASMSLDAQRSGFQHPELLRLFGEASDECDRSDLSLVSGVARNSGAECVMTAILNPASGLAIRVLLPELLEGAWSVSGPSASLEFARSETAPVVAFNNEDFEFDFGGEVRRAWITQSSIVVETYNGCSKVSF